MNKRMLAIVLFLAAACLAWLPFDSYRVLYQAMTGQNVPAGEIVAGFEVGQQVMPPEVDGMAIDAGGNHCFSIQFATYMRTNRGHLDVRLEQPPLQQSWRVAAASLRDNRFRHFCPDAGFSAWRPFEISVAGVDGKPGKSPTLWLVGDTRMGTATSPDIAIDEKGIALQALARNHVTPSKIIAPGSGSQVFVLGWLCTVIAGLLAVAFAFPGRAKGGGKLNRRVHPRAAPRQR